MNVARRLFWTLNIFLATHSTAFAQTHTPVDSKSALRLNYGRREWNLSAKKIDSASIFMREGATGRIVQIELEESAPDSASFSGTYSINWRNLDALKVEFYAPPQNLLADIQGRNKISQMIEAKELRRLPFVLRKDPSTGKQNIEIFDNADQARMAFRAFQSENQLLIALQNKVSDKNQLLDTAKFALEKAELEAASRNLAERMRLGQIEMQKLTALIQQFTATSAAEKKQRQLDAQRAAEKAMTLYRAGQFAEAKSLFEKAVELDPSNRSYYFQFGVTLYKLDEFNRSIVYLDLAEGTGVNAVEREFYRGLNFTKLKDSTSALDAFSKVIHAKDKTMGGSAHFYKGVIYFERRNWVDSQKEFQAVLDESTDSTLDERAEAYIEQILRVQQFEAERAKRWTLTGTMAGIYDDNVLLSQNSDRDRGAATYKQAYRGMLQGSVRYRPMYEADREFAVQLDAMTMSSVDIDLQAVQSISNTDPTVVGITLPWTKKAMVLGKGYKFDFVPGVEATYMSAENNEWKNIFNSITGNFLNLIVISETWFTNFNLELRQDNSFLSSSTGDNNSNALKTKLTWSNINFAFEDKKQILLTDLSFTQNSAVGKNSNFNRIDTGVGYVRPAFWDTTFNTKLSYFLLTYPEVSTNRIDNSFTLALGLSRKITEKITSGLNLSFNANNSNVTANQYKKLTGMFTLTMMDAF